MFSAGSSDTEAEYNAFSERTLAVIKPEAYEHAEAIENHIRNNGFDILAKRTVRLTPEQAAELYKRHYGRHHFPHLVAHISSGPIIAMVLATKNCIQKWRALKGPASVAEAQAYWPDSLRARYGRRTKYGDYFNGIHGSENPAEAQREIHFFFPTMIVGPVLRHWQVSEYIQKHIAATLLPALTALAHNRPAEPILWLAEHLRRHNPNEPGLAPQPPEQRQEKRMFSAGSSDTEAEDNAFSERTLAVIKPEAYEDAEAIENHIRNNGFGILAKRTVRLTPEQAAELYKGHYGRQHFPHLVAHISSGPIIAMVLATKNCIQKWRTLMGPARVAEAQAYWPDSLRACYGRRTKYGDFFNGLHGSENQAEAQREIHFFFPTMIVGPVLRHWQVSDYIQKHIAATLLPALTALAHERPAEPILWLAEHLRRHNPNEPELAPQPPEQREDNRCHTPRPSEESLV